MPDHSPSTDERASLAQLSQSSLPLECTSHLGFGLVLVISCTVPVVETPTPRPTYTPYPTLTPEPKPASPRAMKPTPTFAPELFREAGVEEQFSGDALTAIEKAQRAFDRGMYPEALGDFLEAQRLHGRTSHVLPSKIGTTYLALGQHQAAIRHYTAALEEEDNATDVVNRGITYALDMQCTPAMEDARAALAMEPATGDGIHTDAQANAILAGCYPQQGNHLQALQHADAALEIASKHRYRNSDLETLYLARDSLQAVLDGDMWPEDLFFEPAMSHFDTGMEFFEEGDYAAAIKSFEAARETHGTSSGAIQTMSGEARPCRWSRWLRPRLSALSRLLRLLPLALLHPVADGGLGEDIAGIVRGVAQLAAQPPDDVSHRRGVLALVRSPDPLQQMLVGQRPPGVDRKLDQHPVLDAGERDGASSHRHPALGIVDGQVSPHVGL